MAEAEDETKWTLTLLSCMQGTNDLLTRCKVT